MELRPLLSTSPTSSLIPAGEATGTAGRPTTGTPRQEPTTGSSLGTMQCLMEDLGLLVDTPGPRCSTDSLEIPVDELEYI